MEKVLQELGAFLWAPVPFKCYQKTSGSGTAYSEKIGLYMNSKQLPLIEKCICFIFSLIFTKYIKLFH